MRQALQRRLTYANVVATLAVFIALGGSSYAAVKIKANSVRSGHIKNGQVKKQDLAANSVDSSKVLDGSLGLKDFAAGQLPAGAAGERGPQGPQGERGPQGEQGLKGDTGPTGTVDTSNFYDKAASDGRFLQAPNGRSFMTAVALGADFDVTKGSPGLWSIRFACADPTSAPSSLQFSNLSAASINLFVDNGGADPAHTLMPPHSTTGVLPTDQAGDAVDYDAQGFPGGTIAHIHVLTLNRTTDCHFQLWATEMTGSS